MAAASTNDIVSGIPFKLINTLEESNDKEVCNNDDSADSTITDLKNMNFKQKFEETLLEFDQQHQGSQKKPWTQMRINEVINDIKNGRANMSAGQRRTTMEYYWMAKYDIMTTEDNEDYLIFKRTSPTEPILRIIPREQYYDVLLDIHTSCGHGGRDKMLSDIKNRYYIPKKPVQIFISLCPKCGPKRNVSKRRTVATAPPRISIIRDYNKRGWINIIDFQSCPDGDYKWLLNYQDSTTKYSNLRPLKTIKAVDIAFELLKIFLTFGAPEVLQPDKGRMERITKRSIDELIAMWPGCKISHGTLRLLDYNKSTENTLRAWMSETKSTNWSVGCYFVQYHINTSLQVVTGKTPYKALFGCMPKNESKVPDIPATLSPATESDGRETVRTHQPDYIMDSVNNYLENEDNNMQTIKIEPIDVQHCRICNGSIHLIREFSDSDDDEDYESQMLCFTCKIKQDTPSGRSDEHHGNF